MANMPAGFPEVEDFEPSQVKKHTSSWNFHRDPGTGGRDYGQDHVAPNDSVVVGYSINVESDHNTKGTAITRLVTEAKGIANVPVGVHTGRRLTPGGFTGAGASYTGKVTMQTVSLQDWLPVAINKL